jgi:hypothetical protein
VNSIDLYIQKSNGEIPAIIEKACAEHHYIAEPTLEDLLELEIWATNFVNAYN